MYNNKTQRLYVLVAPDTVWTYFMHILDLQKHHYKPKTIITGPKGCMGQHQTNLEQAEREKKRKQAVQKGS
jgi:hypothetical protein